MKREKRRKRNFNYFLKMNFYEANDIKDKK